MKKFIPLLVMFVVFAAFVVPVLAKGPSAPAGKSNKAHLYLYEKDPADWTTVEGGAWGKMTYDQSGEEFNYVFNGHGLETDMEYTLVYYPDPWPGTGLKCLGSGMGNIDGNVHIKNSLETGLLPMEGDDNYYKNLDVTGDWDINVEYLGTDYPEDLVLVQEGTDITGTSLELVGGGSRFTVTDGSVNGNDIEIFLENDSNPTHTVRMWGTIAADGSMSGDWEDYTGGSRTGTWESTDGAAVFNGAAKIWLVKTDDVQCDAVWNVVGTWEWTVLGTYVHDITITSQDPNGDFEGYGYYPAGCTPGTDCVYEEAITGNVDGDVFEITTSYTPGTYMATATGTIAPDGTISGSSPWTWEMSDGIAMSVDSRMIGWNPTEYLFEEVMIDFTQLPL